MMRAGRGKDEGRRRVATCTFRMIFRLAQLCGVLYTRNSRNERAGEALRRPSARHTPPARAPRPGEVSGGRAMERVSPNPASSGEPAVDAEAALSRAPPVPWSSVEAFCFHHAHVATHRHIVTRPHAPPLVPEAAAVSAAAVSAAAAPARGGSRLAAPREGTPGAGKGRGEVSKRRNLTRASPFPRAGGTRPRPSSRSSKADRPRTRRHPPRVFHASSDPSSTPRATTPRASSRTRRSSRSRPSRPRPSPRRRARSTTEASSRRPRCTGTGPPERASTRLAVWTTRAPRARSWPPRGAFARRTRRGSPGTRFTHVGSPSRIARWRRRCERGSGSIRSTSTSTAGRSGDGRCGGRETRGRREGGDTSRVFEDDDTAVFFSSRRIRRNLRS